MLDCNSITFERAGAEDAAALLDLEKRVTVARIYEPRVKIEDAIKEIQANAFYFIRHRDRIIGSASFRYKMTAAPISATWQSTRSTGDRASPAPQ